MAALANIRRERFAFLYANGRAISDAYREAGFKSKTSGGAAANGCRLLQDTEVLQRVQDLKDESFRRMHMSKDELLAGMARVARFDPRKLTDANGLPIPVHLLDDDTAMAIAGIDFEERAVKDTDGDEESLITARVRKIRSNDRGKAQEMLARYHGLFEQEQRNGADAAAQAFASVLAQTIGQRSGIGDLVVSSQDTADTKALPVKSTT